MSMRVGERVSATYWGPDASRDEGRIADDDEGHFRYCLFARLEVPDMEEAVDSLLLTLLRDGARGMVSPPGRSPVRPARLPISVVVRSIDMTPGADKGRSCLPVPLECLWVALDLADMLDALLVRPLAFGSRSVSIVGKLTALPRASLGIGGGVVGSRRYLKIFSSGERAVVDMFDTEFEHWEKCVGCYPKANE
jgi:hypothetical protein